MGPVIGSGGTSQEHAGSATRSAVGSNLGPEVVVKRVPSPSRSHLGEPNSTQTGGLQGQGDSPVTPVLDPVINLFAPSDLSTNPSAPPPGIKSFRARASGSSTPARLALPGQVEIHASRPEYYCDALHTEPSRICSLLSAVCCLLSALCCLFSAIPYLLSGRCSLLSAPYSKLPLTAPIAASIHL
jgi:hypothetical protein